MFQGKEDIVKVIIAGTSLILFFGIVIILFVLAYRRKHLKHIEEKKTLQATFQKELLLTQLEIQEQTLKNVSQEIHDNIGQTLSLARLTLNVMDMEKDASFEKIYHSQELVGKAIHDLRSLSKTMDTDNILSAGFLNAITFQLQMIEKAGAFSTELNIVGQPFSLGPQKELILFRIFQEALNNAMKHSRATLLSLTIYFTDETFQLDIRDNGCGFSFPSNDGMAGGSGIRNMRNRVQLIGGSFEIKSSPGTGTQIRIHVSTERK